MEELKEELVLTWTELPEHGKDTRWVSGACEDEIVAAVLKAKLEMGVASVVVIDHYLEGLLV